MSLHDFDFDIRHEELTGFSDYYRVEIFPILAMKEAERASAVKTALIAIGFMILLTVNPIFMIGMIWGCCPKFSSPVIIEFLMKIRSMAQRMARNFNLLNSTLKRKGTRNGIRICEIKNSSNPKQRA